MEKRYWICIIGSVDLNKLPQGSDGPMRNAVQLAFENMVGHAEENCWSGWGLTVEHMEEVQKAWNRENGEINKGDAVFISHIQNHLGEVQAVVCKICGKTALEIIDKEA